jgi:hypothetical protein
VERQRCGIEFCVLFGKSDSGTLQFIHQAYGDDAMRRAQVFKWWKRFRKTACSTILLKLAAKGLQHVSEKWVKSSKKCIDCQGNYFEKETITAPSRSSDSE